MKASEVTLGQIFFKGQQNVIPLFQRPYVWTEQDNWLPLWEDVRQATEDALANGARSSRHQRTYFLGAIVLQDRDQEPGQVDLVDVIDGQQRLTTLQVLFASALTISRGLGFETVANKFDELLFNSEKIVSPKYPTDRYKLWPLPQDVKAFQWAVDPVGHQPPPEHRLVEAKSWFTDTIGDWIYTQSDPELSLTVLYETLHKRMQLVQIDLNEADDPQVIFEVLNNRGVQLDAADLVKNLLFQKIQKSDHHTQAASLLEEVWLPLDKLPWRKQISIGRHSRSQLDVLLSYWLPTRNGRMTTIEHTFADIKSWMQDTDADPVDVMRSIRDHADLMLHLRDLPVTNPSGALVDRMTAMDLNALWPVVLYLHGDAQIPADQREKAVLALDSFMMRRMLCRYPTNSYTELMGVLLREMMQEPPERRGDRFVQALLAQSASGRLWPTDQDVRNAMATPNFYKAYSQKRIRTFLTSIENALWSPAVSSAPSGRAVGSKWTIEHLLPQTWRKNWPVRQDGSQLDVTARTESRDAAVHALGNLTLLTTQLNATASNRAWEKKREAISKQALLLLTTQTVLTRPTGIQMSDDAWKQTWDEERIRLRGQWLTDLAVSLWARDSL